MDKIKLLIQSWRALSHSYAVVNQFQCLQLLQKQQLQLFFEDLPLLGGWQSDQTLFDTNSMRELNAIAPLADQKPDIVYRMAYPFDFSLSYPCRHYVFMTTEYGCLRPETCVQSIAEIKLIMQKHDVQIITPSQWSKQGLVNSGLDANKIHIVPHGIDPAIYRPYSVEERAQLRTASGIATDDIVLLNVSTMTGNKGIDVLLKSFALALQRYPKLRLLLKGNDALYTSKQILGQRLTALSAPEQALVLPRISYFGNNLSFMRMAQFYQLADCLVSPYHAEAFNLPVMEAAACGIPVICTQGGPTDDFTNDDFALKINSEIMSDVGNPELSILTPSSEHLTQLIEQVAVDPKWRQVAGPLGHKYVVDKFSWASVTQCLVDVMMT